MSGNSQKTTGQNGVYPWIGLRENLQETMDFTTKYRVFL
jgi:hypothetical protein